MTSHTLRLGIIMVLLGTFDTIFAQKIPITTSSEEALGFYNKGWSHEDNLEPDEAEKAYKKAITRDSTFALAHLRLAMLRDNYEYRREKLKDALKYIDLVSEGEKLWIKARVDAYSFGYDGSKEYDYFKDLVALFPNDEKANYLFGFVNRHHKTYDEEKALQYLKRAVEINPHYAKPYTELAYCYNELGDDANAIKSAERFIELLPEALWPLELFADILMRQSNYSESIEAYEKILEKDPQYPWAIMGITANHNFLDKHSEGRAYLEKINDSTLSDYEYRHRWKAKVVSFIDEGDIQNAIKTLEEQKKASLSGVNKREQTFHIYFTFLRITRLYFESNQAEMGLTTYNDWYDYVLNDLKRERSIQRVKNLRPYYLAYAAYINCKLTKADRLLEEYEQLLEKPNDQLKLLKAKILMERQQYADALDLIKTTDLANPFYQYWNALALIKSGKTKEAQEWLDKIISKNDLNDIDLALVRKKAIKLKN